MNRSAQAVVLTLLGALTLRLTLTDEYLHYVNEVMRWPLVVSGCLLVALSLVHLITGDDAHLAPEEEDDHLAPDEGDDASSAHLHGHDHVPKVAWLLVLPVMVVFVIAPPALGSYVANRSSNRVAAPPSVEVATVPLPPGDPVPVPVRDFVMRARYDPGMSLRSRVVTLTGFVSTNPKGDWFVSRIAMGCCAADATAFRVRVLGQPAPQPDAWVAVTGQWQEPAPHSPAPATPALQAITVEHVSEPTTPYE